MAFMWSEGKASSNTFSDYKFLEEDHKHGENHGNFEYHGRQKYERKVLFPSLFLSLIILKKLIVSTLKYFRSVLYKWFFKHIPKKPC